MKHNDVKRKTGTVPKGLATSLPSLTEMYPQSSTFLGVMPLVTF
jgi:hypothetical protein